MRQHPCSVLTRSASCARLRDQAHAQQPVAPARTTISGKVMLFGADLRRLCMRCSITLALRSQSTLKSPHSENIKLYTQSKQYSVICAARSRSASSGCRCVVMPCGSSCEQSWHAARPALDCTVEHMHERIAPASVNLTSNSMLWRSFATAVYTTQHHSGCVIAKQHWHHHTLAANKYTPMSSGPVCVRPRSATPTRRCGLMPRSSSCVQCWHAARSGPTRGRTTGEPHTMQTTGEHGRCFRSAELRGPSHASARLSELE